jgi:hypothetical protein
MDMIPSEQRQEYLGGDFYGKDRKASKRKRLRFPMTEAFGGALQTWSVFWETTRGTDCIFPRSHLFLLTLYW